jgi:Lrp/AsnC family leucine-responsive transcriptional regulator
MADKKFDLDGFDMRLLELLQVDAKRPISELADAIGLSAPACYRRIRRLRDIGAIEREVAVVAPKTLGWGLTMTVLVVLEREGNRTVSDLLAKFSRHPQVIDCANVTGDYDFAVRLVARDMEDYAELAESLFAHDERVRGFKTLVTIREARGVKALPAAE